MYTVHGILSRSRSRRRPICLMMVIVMGSEGVVEQYVHNWHSWGDLWSSGWNIKNVDSQPRPGRQKKDDDDDDEVEVEDLNGTVIV